MVEVMGEEAREEEEGELEATLSWLAETTMPGWTMLGGVREGGREGGREV